MMNAIHDLRAELIPKTARRLRARRIALGFHSAKAFAEAHGINATTYQHHENGRRSLTMDQLKKYASYLGVHTNALLTGVNAADHKVHMVGEIDGAGSVMLHVNPAATEADIPTIVMPDFSAFTALTVQGDALYPAYRHGDLVFHRPLQPLAGREDQVHGRDCVVDLPTGQRLLRHLVIQASGRCALIGATTPPLLNVVVLAAAPVEYIARAGTSMAQAA